MFLREKRGSGILAIIVIAFLIVIGGFVVYSVYKALGAEALLFTILLGIVAIVGLGILYLLLSKN